MTAFEKWWDARSPKDETTVMAKMVKVYSSAAWNAALEEAAEACERNVLLYAQRCNSACHKEDALTIRALKEGNRAKIVHCLLKEKP